jgi:hypothetical protein
VRRQPRVWVGSTCSSAHPPSETPYATLGQAAWPAATARLVAALLVADGIDPYQLTTRRQGTSSNMDATRGFFESFSASRGCSRPSAAAVSSSVCPIMADCGTARRAVFAGSFVIRQRAINTGTHSRRICSFPPRSEQSRRVIGARCQRRARGSGTCFCLLALGCAVLRAVCVSCAARVSLMWH